MSRLGWAAVLALVSTAIGACSLLTDTDGLTGGADAGGTGDAADVTTAPAGDGATNADGSATGDGNVAEDAGQDAGATCVDDAGCSGGPCVSGRCLVDPTVVASAGVKLFGLVVTDSTLFFGSNTRIYTRGLDGGALAIVDDGGALGQMAADDRYVYFPRNGDISRLPLSGSGTTLVHSQVDSPITTVATSGSEILFIGPDPGNPGPTSLFTLPVDGGVPTEQLKSQLTYGEALFVANGTIYIADRLADCVWTVAVNGPTASKLLQVPGANGVFVAPPLMWVTSYGTGTVYRTLADGTGPLEAIAVGQTAPSQIVVTASDVYFLAGANVMRLPR
ncbi:MAG: hypothetical protein U0235_09000 [Polyangiaceae bacterium]